MISTMIQILILFVWFWKGLKDLYEAILESSGLSKCVLTPNMSTCHFDQINLHRHCFGYIYLFRLVWFGLGYGFCLSPDMSL